MLDIRVTRESDCSVMHVAGRIDATTCEDLEDSLMALLDGGETNIILEMSNTNYISSAGLRVLIVITRQMYDTGLFCLCQVSDHVMEIIEMAGFNTLITVYDDLKDARDGIDKG